MILFSSVVFPTPVMPSRMACITLIRSGSPNPLRIAQAILAAATKGRQGCAGAWPLAGNEAAQREPGSEAQVPSGH